MAIPDMMTRNDFGNFVNTVEETVAIKEIDDQDIADQAKWLLFKNDIPGFCANKHIGSCMVLGISTTSTRPGTGGAGREYLIRPITAYGDAAALHRNRIFAVPMAIVPNFAVMEINYVTLLSAAITKFVPIEMLVDSSIVTMYEYFAKNGDDDDQLEDRSVETEMTLKNLNERIQEGNASYDLALNNFVYANTALAARIGMRTQHRRTSDVDQTMILNESAQAVRQRIGSSIFSWFSESKESGSDDDDCDKHERSAVLRGRTRTFVSISEVLIDEHLLMPDCIRKSSAKIDSRLFLSERGVL